MSNVDKNLKAIAQDYSQRVEKHGSTAVAAGWANTETQKLRFDQLHSIIDQDLEGFSLSDLGCGYGAFIELMPDELQNKITLYNGYDISEKMVQAGQKKFEKDNRYSFFCSSNIVEKTDYVIASGIFNHHCNANPDDWKKHIIDTIKHMHESAIKGIAFNIMTTYVDYQEDYIFYCDPAEMLKICMDNFGRHVSLHHNYDLFEFTVLIEKSS